MGFVLTADPTLKLVSNGLVSNGLDLAAADTNEAACYFFATRSAMTARTPPPITTGNTQSGMAAAVVGEGCGVDGNVGVAGGRLASPGVVDIGQEMACIGPLNGDEPAVCNACTTLASTVAASVMIGIVPGGGFEPTTWGSLAKGCRPSPHLVSTQKSARISPARCGLPSCAITPWSAMPPGSTRDH